MITIDVETVVILVGILFCVLIGIVAIGAVVFIGKDTKYELNRSRNFRANNQNPNSWTGIDF